MSTINSWCDSKQTNVLKLTGVGVKCTVNNGNQALLKHGQVSE